MSQAYPKQLGKYMIDGVLGSGAMGLVYQATDPMIQRRVALKTIHRSLVDDDDMVSAITARFRNEAQAAGRLSHPGIVSIYEYGEDGDTAFIAMEFVEGKDLSKVLAANPTISEPMLLQVMDQLLAALHYAHEQGVWHRDIKPANLILTKSGQLKITDFGIARIRNAAITQVTSTIGTHGYMAPEQYKGQDIDHRVDIFAAGVLLYRLLTGHAPFSGAPESIMYKVLHEDPAPPSSAAKVPRTIQVDAVVAKALARDARDRYPTAGAFREALRLHAAKTAQGNAVIASALHDDETVVDPQAMQSLRTAMPTPAAATGGHWEPEVLTSLERALASFVGPLAKMLVKQAAASSGDYQTLVGAVARHLHTDDERARFMSKVGRPAGTSGTSGASGSSATSLTGTVQGGTAGQASNQASTLGRGAGTSPSGISPSGTSLSGAERALTPAFIAHATRVLASHMGPMAKVLVKKAESKAQGADTFIELLVQSSADGVDLERLRKELRQGLESQAGH